MLDEETTAQQAAVEDANARSVDPDVEEDDDIAVRENDFELYNPEDMRNTTVPHARKWTSYEI
jgi:hypothetical protein